MRWVPIEERMPKDEDTIDGRFPILDDQGYLGFALMAGPAGHKFLISDFNVKYWLEAVPAAPEEFL